MSLITKTQRIEAMVKIFMYVSNNKVSDIEFCLINEWVKIQVRLLRED